MAEIRTGTPCSWGVGYSTTTSYGRVRSARRTKSAGTEAEIPDQDGDVVTFILAGIRQEAELEIVPTSTTYTTPAVGDTLTITDTLSDLGASVKFTIISVGDNQTIGDVASITVTVRKYPDITLT